MKSAKAKMKEDEKRLKVVIKWRWFGGRWSEYNLSGDEARMEEGLEG